MSFEHLSTFLSQTKYSLIELYSSVPISKCINMCSNFPRDKIVFVYHARSSNLKKKQKKYIPFLIN